MQRGSDLEPMAREAFEEETGVNVEPVGFITTDDGRLGCPPDGIIRRANGSNVREGVEIKSPAPHTHVYYLTYGLGENYVQQVQGQMYVAELDIAYFYFYHPELPSFFVETRRDEAFIRRMRASLECFCRELDEKEQMVRTMLR